MSGKLAAVLLAWKDYTISMKILLGAKEFFNKNIQR